jgi:AbrB family looped-hinge helix DNA binding protein
MASPRSDAYVGQRLPRSCTLRGREGEGRWFIVRKGRDHTRVVNIRPDGTAGENALLVSTADVVETPPSEGQGSQANHAETTGASNVIQVGQRGVIVIPANLRSRLGLAEGSFVLLEEHQGGIWLRPALFVPRPTGP